ncbi:hypothetical protein O235_02186, partial [Staphylococcus aureus M0024]
VINTIQVPPLIVDKKFINDLIICIQILVYDLPQRQILKDKTIKLE